MRDGRRWKMGNIKTTHILGIITIVELITTKSMAASVILWALYGIYCYYQYD